MSAQLIFSDLDGTLINDDLKVTAATRDAIRRQIINGNIFVPASARLPKGMMTVVNQILKVCPFIAYNGALALDETGKVLISRFFNAKEAAEICRYVDEQDNDAAWNIYSGYVWYCSEEKSPRVKNEERIVDVKATPTTINQLEKLQGVHKGLIMGDSADLDRMQEELPTFFSSNIALDDLEEFYLTQNTRGELEPLKAKRIMERIRFLVDEVVINGENRRNK